MKPRFRKRQERRERRRICTAADRAMDSHLRIYDNVNFPISIVFVICVPQGADRTHYIRTGEWAERAS